MGLRARVADGTDDRLEELDVLPLEDGGHELGAAAEAAVVHRLPLAPLGVGDRDGVVGAALSDGSADHALDGLGYPAAADLLIFELGSKGQDGQARRAST